MAWLDYPEWDAAILADGEISVGGDRTADRRSSISLRRPGQLICDTRVWLQPEGAQELELRERLGAADAEETRSAPRLERDDVRVGVAERLGLTLLNVADEDAPALNREGRRLAPDALSVNHVLIANPQRHGGCAKPRPLGEEEAQVEIPSAAAQSDGPTVAVLDTGIVEDAPFSVLPDPDIEPPVPDGLAKGHGTMVAGVLRRYAPTAQILIKRVLRMPLGDADELEIAAALAELPPVDIVNASFGGPAADDTRMLALQRALEALPSTTLVVASAGNEGLARRHYMAAFKGVVGVGSAAETDGQLGVCFYSNRGRWVDVSTQGSGVETVIAPGKPVEANGTSFAAPKIVARILAVAAEQDIGVRHAASWLINESGGQAIAGGGTFVDMPVP